jgi:multidrug resistance efflux pump
LAVIDSDSFRVEAYPEETKLNFVKVPNGTILSSGMTATVRIEPKHESEKEAHLVFSESRAGKP